MNAPTPSSPFSSAADASASFGRARTEWADPRFRRLLLVQSTFGYAFSALLVAPKYAVTSLHATPREIGALAACTGIAVVAATPVVGRALDRGGARFVMIAGTGLLAVATLLFARTTEMGPFIYGLRALHGVASAAIMGSTGAFVTLFAPAERHGRAFGTASSASLVMNAAGPAATEYLAGSWGWRVAFQVAGSIALAGVAVALALPNARSSAPSPSSSLAGPVERKSADASGWRAIGAGAFAAGVGFGMISTFTQPYALSLGGQNVAALFVGYTVTVLIVRVGLGGLVDRFGRQQSALVALMLYAFVTAGAAALRPGGMFVLGLGFGVAHGLVWPALSALAVERSARARAPSALARLYALFCSGAFVTVWVGGWLVGAVGYEVAFLATSLAVALGAAPLTRRFA